MKFCDETKLTFVGIWVKFPQTRRKRNMKFHYFTSQIRIRVSLYELYSVKKELNSLPNDKILGLP